MADVLSQNEIDALLSAVSAGEVETNEEKVEAPKAAPTEGSLDWVYYDLTSQEKLVRGRLVGLEGIHERFSRKLRGTLVNFLKKNVTVNYKSTEFMRFGEYLSNLTLPTSLNLINIEKPMASMAFVMGPKLTFAMIDAYYGGSERPFAKMGGREDFTKIEKQLIRKVVEFGVKDLEEAWRLNYPISLKYDSMESNPHFVGSIHGSESVAIVNFEIEFENLSGPFVIVLPLAPIDSIRQFLSINITREIEDNRELWKSHWLKEIQQISVGMEVKLGQKSSDTREVLKLKKGDVLTLEEDAVSPLTVRVEGLPKFKGTMGVYRGSTAIRISDVAPFQDEEEKEGQDNE